MLQISEKFKRSSQGVPIMKLCQKVRKTKEKTPKTLEFPVFGGDKGSRTPDLLNAIQALSQLSYTPKRLKYVIADLFGFGGGEGSRTPVRKPLNITFYECISSF